MIANALVAGRLTTGAQVRSATDGELLKLRPFGRVLLAALRGALAEAPPPRFTAPPRPALVPSKGFTAGVLSIEWTGDSLEITGREGRLFTARVAAIDTYREMLDSKLAFSSLVGLVVKAPDGSLARITGVETFLQLRFSVSGPAGDIGLLLAPVDE